jgi:hypothetical protein
VGHVAGGQLQTVRDGKRRDHWIATANRPTDTIQIASYLSRQISGGLVKYEDFFPNNSVAKGLDTVQSPDPLIPLDDFHHRNDRQRQEPMRLPVSGGVTGNGLVNAFGDFREDVRIEQRFIYQDSAATAAPP